MGRARNGARMLTSVRRQGAISKNGVQFIGQAYRDVSNSGRRMKKINLTCGKRKCHDYVSTHVEHALRRRR